MTKHWNLPLSLIHIWARSCSPENILAVSEYLQKVTILEGDFQDACRDAARGDFVFFDSPYAPLNPSSFESYTKEGFDVESHQRLAGLFRELTERGCSCMLTNHNTDFINELYAVSYTHLPLHNSHR